MTKQKNILCLMDYGPDCKTGFATVSRNIKSELKRNFGDDLVLHIVAVNHFGENIIEKDSKEEACKTIVIPAKLADPRGDDFGRYLFLDLIKNSDYDGIFIIQDLSVMVAITPHLELLLQEKREAGKKQFKSVFYFPVDCNLFLELTLNLEFYDKLVTYTEFGREQVLKFRPELKNKLSVIPHGNNPDDFYPMHHEEASKFRQEFFGENADKFIILNVNRNQPRKDIPNTIFGFIEAKRIWEEQGLKSKPFLYLHTHPKDPLGHDLRAVLKQTELEEMEDYMLLPKRFERDMASVEELNKIYNACDMFLTTSLGEGWGLTATEAMATSLPVVVPYNTAFMELSGHGNRAYLMETQIPFCSHFDNQIREQTDYIEVADKIIEVASKVLSGYSAGLNAKTNAAIEFLDSITWDKVCKRWIDIFKEVY